jgi:hypothetical protein
MTLKPKSRATNPGQALTPPVAAARVFFLLNRDPYASSSDTLVSSSLSSQSMSSIKTLTSCDRCRAKKVRCLSTSALVHLFTVVADQGSKSANPRTRIASAARYIYHDEALNVHWPSDIVQAGQEQCHYSPMKQRHRRGRNGRLAPPRESELTISTWLR